MTTAIATANARIIGTPATARPRVVSTSARAAPPGLGRSTCARPRTAIELTSVAMTGGSERRVTSRPLTHPTAAPAARARTTPMRKNPIPCCAKNDRITADSATTDPMLRSMPPVMTTTSCARPTRISTLAAASS
ncbi:hypothetical protein SRABI128_00296 [Microbacterium sp. Bi128]|nr:hypothetical protein SRABI128_00296 [Microbacterium sp. Bi128]